MEIKLENCKLITSEEYIDLVNPIFKGQTKLNDRNMYYMIWESDGVLYKTHMSL